MRHPHADEHNLCLATASDELIETTSMIETLCVGGRYPLVDWVLRPSKVDTSGIDDGNIVTSSVAISSVPVAA